MAKNYTEIIAEAEIKPSLFNKYKRLGLLPRPQRVDFQYGTGCTAYYPDDIVDRIRQIQELKAQGKTLAEIKDELDEIVPIFLVNEEFTFDVRHELDIPEVGAYVDAYGDSKLRQWVQEKRPGYTLDSVTLQLIQKDGKDFYRLTKVKVKPKEQ